MQENKRKQQSFQYGAIILLCSTMLVKIIGAIFKMPLSELIGTLGFGYFDSAYQLFTPIYTLAMAGLPIAISRVVAERMQQSRYQDVRKTLKVTKKIFLITGLSGFVLMLLLIYPFVHFTDATGKTVYSLFAIAPSLLICCIMSVYRGYYEGLRNMYPTAISDVIEALGKLILGLGFAYIILKMTDEVAFAAAGAMLGIVVGGIASATFLTLRYKIKGDGITKEEFLSSPEPQDSKTIAKTIIMIAIPVVLASLANTMSSLVDVSMVKWQLTNMMGEFANDIRNMYNASIADYNANLKEGATLLSNDELPTFLYGVRGQAFTLYNLVPTITSVLGVSALPVLTSCFSKGEGDKRAVKHSIESTMKFTALISMPAGIGFAFLGPEIMSLLYSSVAAVEIGGT
ncbi:MAG: oligosaccharide flippase family protein, partial [Clostridia bacterium]|nr:oligosaccharide flippase family protein [Clostridia bacterium]